MNKQVDKVSIIIPIYNAEPFLRQCLDSIKNQTYSNLEILCINDGSTDGSLSIMREYELADSRFRVIDKPNGGYGHSVNRGLSEATGEYIAIVEPDDFLDTHMYADLMQASFLEDGSRAQIVKSSYWLYFDVEGEEARIEAPNLMNCMPKEQFQFSVSTHWEVLYHHPSIWTAIYKKSFIDEKRIKLIEPKGAGWADNPFFFETILQATSIVWVPSAYYYYRQTNPNASSNLKDYRLPFDRLRDLQGVLKRLKITDPNILICFYNRVFSYIGTVINEEGFPERNPEILALIKEILGSMDRKVLYGARRGIHKDFLEYYEDVMGLKNRKIIEVKDREDPLLSIIVPTHNNRGDIWSTLSALTACPRKDFEVLCVDAASEDRTHAISREYAQKDSRIYAVEVATDKLSVAQNEGLARAKGTFSLFLQPGMIIEGDELEKLLKILKPQPSVDVVVFGKRLPLLEDWRIAADYSGAGKDKKPEFDMVDIASKRIELFLVNGRMMSESKLFRTDYLRTLNTPFFDHDLTSMPLFCLNAIWNASSSAALTGVSIDDRDLRLSEELRGECGALLKAELSTLDFMWDYVEVQANHEMERAFRNYVFIQLSEMLRKYACCVDSKDAFSAVTCIVQEKYGIKDYGGMYYLVQAAYQYIQQATASGFDAFLTSELWSSRVYSQRVGKRNEKLKESLSYKLGNAVVRRVKRAVRK